MILTPEDFENALEEALQRLAADAGPRQQDLRLMALMKDLAAYRPKLAAGQVDEPEAGELSRLNDRLKQFEAQLPSHLESHWHTLASEI